MGFRMAMKTVPTPQISGGSPMESANGKANRPGTSGGEPPLLSIDRAQIGYLVDGQFQVAVREVSFDLRSGETVMLLGPSGCGKSTLLKAVAGFLEPTAGSICVAGQPVREPGPDRAVVFQEFDQLFPWRTVADNIAYPLRINGRSRSEATAVAETYLELMGLTTAARRYPHQLSGGMKQRVAIARAMALNPLMLLMDEPFGSLDAQTRGRLQRELIEVAAQTRVSIVFVTHSIQEAIYVGHRIVVLSRPPTEVTEIVDVTSLTDPTSPEFATVEAHLRDLLAGGDASLSGATFE